MKVLALTNMYPSPDAPAYGIFVKHTVEALRDAGLDIEVLFVDGRRRKAAYLAAPFRVLKRSGARFRHSVRVRTMTSGRLRGRVADGLAGTLRRWAEGEETVLVEAPEAVLARLRRRARLRAVHAADVPDPLELAAVADAFAVEPAWLGERLAERSSFFHLAETLDRQNGVVPAGVPLEVAIEGLRRLLELYGPARSKRSSRQVASRSRVSGRKPGWLSASACTWSPVKG